MSAASAVAAAKSNLVTALTTLWQTEDVLVTYGPTLDEPDELVQILDTAFVEGKGPMSNLRRRDFAFTIDGQISCTRGGGRDVQQTVTERALELLGDISDYLQDSGTPSSTKVSLGGAVQWARVSAAVVHENDGLTEDEDIELGPVTTIAFTITGLIRA